MESLQVQVGDLPMGHGTSYVVTDFNPWNRTVRASGEGDNPWGHGGYSGAEWLATAVVNMGIHVIGENEADWMTKHFELMRAFSPVETGPDVELHWAIGNTEYMMRGRPRMLNPRVRNMKTGKVLASASFVALDPLIYSGQLHEVTLGLPTWSGGLAVPMEIPMAIDAVIVGGAADLTNAGQRTARILARVEGPVSRPSIRIGTSTLTLDMDIPEGHWVDIDTGDQTVFYDGHISRLQDAHGSWPVLPPGTHELRFTARRYNPDAQLIVRWRDTY